MATNMPTTSHAAAGEEVGVLVASAARRLLRRVRLADGWPWSNQLS